MISSYTYLRYNQKIILFFQHILTCVTLFKVDEFIALQKYLLYFPRTPSKLLIHPFRLNYSYSSAHLNFILYIRKSSIQNYDLIFELLNRLTDTLLNSVTGSTTKLLTFVIHCSKGHFLFFSKLYFHESPPKFCYWIQTTSAIIINNFRL